MNEMFDSCQKLFDGNWFEFRRVLREVLAETPDPECLGPVPLRLAYVNYRIWLLPFTSTVN